VPFIEPSITNTLGLSSVIGQPGITSSFSQPGFINSIGLPGLSSINGTPFGLTSQVGTVTPFGMGSFNTPFTTGVTQPFSGITGQQGFGLQSIGQRPLGIGFQPTVGLQSPVFGVQQGLGLQQDGSQRQIAQIVANTVAQCVQQVCQQCAPQAAQCAAECVQTQTQQIGLTQLAPIVAQCAAQCAQQAVQTTAPILAQRAAQLCLIQCSQIGGNSPQAFVQIAAHSGIILHSNYFARSQTGSDTRLSNRYIPHN
jgi:hypothetical protein